MLSALKRALVLMVIGFVLWALVRQRGSRAGLRTEAPRSTDQAGAVDRPDLSDQPVALEASTEPPKPSPTPVRWEPPVRSVPPVSGPASAPAPADESGPTSRSRGRIEDLLERARNEDEGAA